MSITWPCWSMARSVAYHSGQAATGVIGHLDVPDGWTVTGGDVPVSLNAGATATVQWTATVPADATTATSQLTAEVGYNGGQTGATTTVNVRSIGDQYISDLPFVSATNGFGPVERDTNVGGNSSGDGGPITLRGTVYPKGLGTNSVSQIVVNLAGAGCTSFTSDVGIDDSASGAGSVTFTVLADGVTVASTGTLTGRSAVAHLTANITGSQTLTLQVGDAGDGNGHDNGDWAGAEVHCSS